VGSGPAAADEDAAGARELADFYIYTLHNNIYMYIYISFCLSIYGINCNGMEWNECNICIYIYDTHTCRYVCAWWQMYGFLPQSPAVEVRVEANVITFNSSISACAQGGNVSI
jgi:hypothetical protein